MKIEKNLFGTDKEGKSVYAYTVSNGEGLETTLSEYGAAITSLRFPDKDGKIEELTLGFDELTPYLQKVPYFGATVGRFANRIGKGEFSINGKRYSLHCNEGKNHLHGGIIGFDKRTWRGAPFTEDGEAGVVFHYTSPAGEEGYPGNLSVQVRFSVSPSNGLTIHYTAETDAPTPINLTNHAYWNLEGPGSTSILDHTLQLTSSSYLPVDENLIPRGEKKPVDATAFDFRGEKRIGDDIEKAGGYDHCFVIDPSSEKEKPAAVLFSPLSGRRMEVRTTLPGIQFYTGNFLTGAVDRRGTPLPPRSALCLETQNFPDAPNKPEFPKSILEPGETYRETTTMVFSV